MRLLPLLLLVAAPVGAHAQWRVDLLAGSATVSGHARDGADPDHPQLRPDHPATWVAALSHDAGSWRLGVDARRTTADLGEVSSSTAVITRGALAAWEGAAELGRRIAGAPERTSLTAGAAVVWDRWQFRDITGASRSRWGGRGDLELAIPLGAHLSGIVRGEVLFEQSLFDADELPDGFTRQSGVRSGLLLGLARRW
ncbi:MAG TPA: hypothetical protein VHW65_03235 [Gemmatimonadales bacterium]|jgi:hypothetical protein|nr:hypothetical protein [Gemmatimonadales bacterium]